MFEEFKTRSHLPEFVGFDKETNQYKWKCSHCNKQWSENVNHGTMVTNSNLYNGYFFNCIRLTDPWWLNLMTDAELKKLHFLPVKKVEKFIDTMNKLNKSETKFAGARTSRHSPKFEDSIIINKPKLQIVDVIELIENL